MTKRNTDTAKQTPVLAGQQEQSAGQPAHVEVKEGMIGGTACLVVDVRKLHAFLKVGRDFTSWLKTRIRENGFVEGEDYDFVLDSPNLGNQEHRHGGSRRGRAYICSMDMAKHLCMAESNEVGRQTRKYFLDCERQRDVLLKENNALLAAKSARLEQQLAERAALPSGETPLGRLGWSYEGAPEGAADFGNNKDVRLVAVELAGAVLLRASRQPAEVIKFAQGLASAFGTRVVSVLIGKPRFDPCYLKIISIHLTTRPSYFSKLYDDCYQGATLADVKRLAYPTLCDMGLAAEGATLPEAPILQHLKENGGVAPSVPRLLEDNDRLVIAAMRNAWQVAIAGDDAQRRADNIYKDLMAAVKSSGLSSVEEIIAFINSWEPMQKSA